MTEPLIHPKVTLKATNVSLAEVLEQIAAQTGLQYSQHDIGGNGLHLQVFFWPPVEKSDTFEERAYWVPPNFFNNYAPSKENSSTSGGVRKTDVMDQLKARGILLPEGASAMLLITIDRGKMASEKLVARNNLEQLDLIALLLDMMSIDYRTSVEVKSTSAFCPY